MRRRLASIWLVSLLGGAAAWGAEWRSEKHKCAISYPGEGWAVVETPPDPRMVFVVTEAGEAQTVYLYMVDVDDAVWLNDAFIRGVEKGALKARPPPIKSITKLSGRRLVVAGVPAYELVVRSEFEQGHTTLVMRSFIANGWAYSLGGIVVGGDAVADASVQEVLSSFHFTSPPEVPKERSSEETLAFRIGEFLGGGLIIVLIVWAVTRIFRR